MERSYALVLKPDVDGGYSVDVPAFQGAHTQGETIDECIENARDLIRGFVELYTERGEPLPPSDLATVVSVSIPAA